MYRITRPFLFGLDAERAHELSLKMLDAAFNSGVTGLVAKPAKVLPTRAFGLTFPNPVGLAAGLDKNGAHIDALLALGFGFIEIGTVTPKPQAGNPKPRLFRLPQHGAIINRMGFNNLGVDALVENVRRAQRRSGLLGINIGKNKDTPNEQAAQDYLFCLERVFPLADYVTVNISSPNTAGLRELQEESALRQLLSRLRDAQETLGSRHRKRVPMLVKLAPDLSDRDIDAACRVLGDLNIDGVIATNTTITRPGAAANHALAKQAGGLSGTPLMEQSTLVLRKLRKGLPESIPLIGVGGIDSGADALTKISAGATLVQLYSGLVYRGPELIGECIESIRRRKEFRAGAAPA